MKRILFLLAILNSLFGQAQSILTLSANTGRVNVGQVGKYDRVNTVCTLRKGNWYLLLLPADLDGYYFGPDAPRYTIESYTDAADGTGCHVMGLEEMDDEQDFEAGKCYVVNPKVDIDSIIHITAGIKTQVKLDIVGKDIACLSVADDPATAVGGLKDPKFQDSSFNGQSFIIYDLDGCPAKDLKKGEFYIINGKKVRF